MKTEIYEVILSQSSFLRITYSTGLLLRMKTWRAKHAVLKSLKKVHWASMTGLHRVVYGLPPFQLGSQYHFVDNGQLVCRLILIKSTSFPH